MERQVNKFSRASQPLLPPGALALTYLVAASLLWCSEACAQTVEFRGNATARGAIQTGDGDLQIGELLIEPEIAGAFGDSIRFTAIGRLRIDVADELEPGDPGSRSDSRSFANRRLFIGDDVDAELREAYADIIFRNWFLRLGKQQVVWGQADGLRVLDQVNPLSFREFILGDFEDRRIPLWTANIERTFGNVTAQFLWIPDHTFNEIPDDGKFTPSSPLFVPEVSGGMNLPVSVGRADRPDRFLLDDDFGVRLSGFTAGWDWSLNTLYTFDDTRIFRRETLPGEIRLTPDFERTLLLGGTASNAFGKATLRAEIGFTTDSFELTSSPLDTDGIHESGEVSGVVGFDYQANADLFISSQLFLGVLTKDDVGLIRDQTTSTASMLVRQQLHNNTIALEALLLQDLNNGDGLLQMSVAYQLNDDVTLKAGGDVFYGDSSGVFGQFGSADRIIFSIECGF